MGVAEGVDLEGADVGGQKNKVLDGGGEHVPRVEVEKGHEEVETEGTSHGDDQVGEDVVSQVKVRVVFVGVFGFDLANDDEDCCECGVDHYHGVDYH